MRSAKEYLDQFTETNARKFVAFQKEPKANTDKRLESNNTRSGTLLACCSSLFIENDLTYQTSKENNSGRRPADSAVKKAFHALFGRYVGETEISCITRIG